MEREEYHRQLDKMRGQLDEMRGKGRIAMAEMRGRAEELGELAAERPAWTLGLGSLGLLSVLGILALAVFAPRTFRRVADRFFDMLGF